MTSTVSISSSSVSNASASSHGITTPSRRNTRGTMSSMKPTSLTSLTSTANTAVMGGRIRPQAFQHAKQLVQAHHQTYGARRSGATSGTPAVSKVGSDTGSSTYIGSIYTATQMEQHYKDAILQPTDSTEADVNGGSVTSGSIGSKPSPHAVAYLTAVGRSHEEEKKDSDVYHPPSAAAFTTTTTTTTTTTAPSLYHPSPSLTTSTTSVKLPNRSTVLVAEMSPMMRMRHSTLLPASSGPPTTTALETPTTAIRAPTNTHAHAQSRRTIPTEEQVKAHKQKTWKRKMKMARQEREEEQASLHEEDDADLNYRYDIDVEEGTAEEDEDDRTANNSILDQHNLLKPSWSATTGSTGYDSYGYDAEDDEDHTVDRSTVVGDDEHDPVYGCQAGSALKLSNLKDLTLDDIEQGLEDLWSSLTLSKTSSTMGTTTAEGEPAARRKTRSTAKAGSSSQVRFDFEQVAHHPAEMIYKLVNARCGIDLEEMSSTELYDDEEDSFHNRNNNTMSDDDDLDDDDSRGRRRRRGRSRQPRSKSPGTSTCTNSAANRRNFSRETSRASTSSRQTATTVGDILDGSQEHHQPDPAKTGTAADPEGVKHEETGSQASHSIRNKQQQQQQQQQQRPSKCNFSVVSGGSSKTPQAGTTQGRNHLPATAEPPRLDPVQSEEHATQDHESRHDRITSASGSVVGSILSGGGGSKIGGLSKAASGSAISVSKTVSFDESTICKTAPADVIPPITALDKTDPNFIKFFVAGMNRHGTPLLWHRTERSETAAGSFPTSKSESLNRPASVLAYLQLDSTKRNPSGITTSADGFEIMSATTASAKVRIPSTTWDSPRLVLFQETISEDGGVDKTEVGAIDLFDIVSIETSTNSSTAFQTAVADHPLIQPTRAMVIRLNSSARINLGNNNSVTANGFLFPSQPAAASPKVFVMEATSEDAAKTLVLGLKWTVARLAFNLVVGNLSISCELLQPEQQQPQPPRKTTPLTPPEERSGIASCTSGDEESMGPQSLRRPIIIRRTKVMNDMTFHMTDGYLERTTMLLGSTSMDSSATKTTARRSRPKSQDPPGTFV